MSDSKNVKNRGIITCVIKPSFKGGKGKGTGRNRRGAPECSTERDRKIDRQEGLIIRCVRQLGTSAEIKERERTGREENKRSHRLP